MRPFFSFYGSKWRIAPKYPAPGKVIIEPFAGSAGYATRYPDREIHLYDVDPTICGIWDYLIHVSAEEIRALPATFDHVDDLDVVLEAKSLMGYWTGFARAYPNGNHPAKKLVGFWINKACSTPCKTLTQGTAWHSHTSIWGEKIRERIASQVDSIRHWTIEQSSYVDIPDREATWFVDPPYKVAGKFYKYHDIDYSHLGEWCKSRTGQVIVCENEGADWLTFEPFCTVNGNRNNKGKEVVWVK